MRPTSTSSKGTILPAIKTAEPWTDTQAPGIGEYSDLGYAVYGGNMQVDVRDASGKGIPKAIVKLYGQVLASTVTDMLGQAALGPLLPANDYRLVVEAEGYTTQVLSGLKVEKLKSDTSNKPVLEQHLVMEPGGTLSGLVRLDNTPVAGAVVSDGTGSTITDASGHYTLKGVKPGGVTLTASKARYATATASASVAAGQTVASDLALAQGEAIAYLDAASASFNGLKSALTAKGWAIATTPPERGTWLLSAYANDLSSPSDERIEQIAGFVAQGGRLIVLGEWGGQGTFHTPTANNLLHRFGLHLNTDLVRESTGEALTVSSFTPSSAAVAGLAPLQFYGAASVFGIAPMADWARSGNAAYRVQQMGTPAAVPVVAGGPFKGGKVVVIGDTSAFSDEDTDGDGTPNLAEAANQTFIEQVFDW